jgi:hypothetical protein
LIRRAIIALTALALVVALAVPAFAQDDVATNTATANPVGQTGTISQTAQQCVEGDVGDINECEIEDNGDDNGDGDTIIVDQENVGNEQDATAVGGEGGDNFGLAVAVGDDINADDDNGTNGDDDDNGNGDDNVAATVQNQQCQNATASNQIENDAAVQNDTILSNNNAGDVENIGNVCQQAEADAQQQAFNDDDDNDD